MVRVASPIFVGRAPELAVLDGALDAASQGQTSTVLIGGDAGVGKTRLLETWNDQAARRGARVVTGSCVDFGESGPAYVAVVQALRDLIGPLDPGALDELLGSDRSTLARVIPELLADSATTADDEGMAPIAQTRLLDRLARVLGRASADTPLVLELEDIHWADPSTRAFLLYLVANARSGRLLIVATFRSEEAGVDDPVTAMLRELERHPRTARIDLRPFETDELREQLGGILGEPPTSGLLAAIQTRSEGNALFAEELIASGDPTGELPSSIGAALLARTAGLSAAAHFALRVASVAGRTSSYDLLSSATGLADDRLDAALHEVVGQNILEAEQAGEHYRFRHALLQEAIYRDALPGERRRLHAAVAEALEGDAAARPVDPELASRLAYHWFKAKDPDRALRASLVAGDAAVRQAAYAEALHQFERVLELWDQAPEAHADLRLVDILERASRGAFIAGEPDRTVTYARRALGELDVTDDTVLRVRALDELTRGLYWTINPEASEQELRLARIDTDGLPVREQMIVLNARAGALLQSGEPGAARDAALDALRLADAIDDPELKAHAHLSIAGILFQLRDFAGVIGEARLAREFASIAGDAETEVQALDLLFETYMDAGELETAIVAARTARAYADRVGMSQWEGPAASRAEAQALLKLGRITESAGLIEAALLDPPANPAVLSQFRLLAAQVAIIRGSLGDAAAHLDAARQPDATLEEETGRGWLATVRAELASAEGRLDDVRAIVDATASRLADASPVSTRSEAIWGLIEIGLDAEATRAEVARAAGDAQALEEFSAVASTLVGYGDAVRRQDVEAGVLETDAYDGERMLIAGQLARMEGRDDPSLWAAAAESFPPRSRRALAARYRQAEAMVAVRAPVDQIRAVLIDGHTMATDIGALPLAGRFEALARRARIRLGPTPSAVRADEAALDTNGQARPGVVALRERGLSDREIEVLTLVAAGFSNQDIGTRLFITDKTASVHVSHILAKLDVATRTQAATIGVRLGLPDVEKDESPTVVRTS